MKVNKKKELWQFIKFGMVGVLNTLVDNLIFLGLLFLGLHRSIAKTVSYSIATLHSYLWNKHWTFQNKEKKNGQLLSKFIVVNLVSLGASLLVLHLFSCFVSPYVLAWLDTWKTGVDFEKTVEVLANLFVAGPFSILVNFVGNRLWVFRQKTQEEGEETK